VTDGKTREWEDFLQPEGECGGFTEGFFKENGPFYALQVVFRP